LRQESLAAQPTISAERAALMTEFYQQNLGFMSEPVRRALSFNYLMEHQTVYIGPGELIVGEKGPAPKATPTYPELCCHSLQDLDILNTREKTWYTVSPEDRQVYQDKVIPFWQNKSMRDSLFREMTDEWKAAYEAGIFTEFMEQRAPGHTVLDDKIYRKGMLDLRQDIQHSLRKLDFMGDPQAYAKQQELQAMAICADGLIRFAERHADKARELAQQASDPKRKAELERIAEVCSYVPAHAPRDFWEACVLLVRPSGCPLNSTRGLVACTSTAISIHSTQRASRKAGSLARRQKSFCSACGSSSTTSLRRPRWVLRQQKAAPTLTFARSTRAASTTMARTASTQSRT
jgi:formate C-acetyltransferase